MPRRRFLHMILALALIGLNTWTPAAMTSTPLRTYRPQETKPTPAAATDLAAKLAAIEKVVEEQRKEKGIPGLSLVIVKDDQVIYAKGFGLRDVEHHLPVTPDTLFAIGSCTKAFTAMAAVISQDEGKLSLDDSPKKYLPFFKINDPQIDAKVTIRDLLSHRSGLAGTDIAWYTGGLNREEVIRVAGMAKPTAALGEKFQYQNVMYSAAGEVVAKAQGTTWEKLMSERFLRPLGMKATRLSVHEMQQASDYSFGYDYNADTKKNRKLPTRDLTNIAPAGAINSNARDMAQWVRLLLGGGEFEGKRFVSEKGFAQLFSKVTNVAPHVDYGLGWIVADWNGHQIALHDGGIDGFNSEVDLVPDQKLGFVLLTNVSQAGIMGQVRSAILNNLVEKPEASKTAAAASDAPAVSAADMQREVGTYRLAEANADMQVVFKDGKLFLTMAGQPDSPMVSAGGRRYKLADPAPADSFITFRPVKDNEAETEAYLDLPMGKYVMRKTKAVEATTATKDAAAGYDGQLKDTLGSYVLEGATINITVKEGKVVLVVPGQPDYPLVEKEKDHLSISTLPATYGALIKRDAEGKVSALVLKQPEGEFEFKRVAEFNASVSVDELMTKVIAAHGGEANLRKHKSMQTTFTLAFLNQGVSGEGFSSSRAPNHSMQSLTFIALGKKIGTLREFFDGTSGGAETSFSAPETKNGKQLEDARIASDFYALPNWKTLFKSVVIKKMEKVGDEDAYVVLMTPERGNPVTDYVSTKSFLILKRETVNESDDEDRAGMVTETYADYRLLDGVMIPFKVVQQSPGFGETIIQFKEVKFDVPLPDSLFRAQAK